MSISHTLYALIFALPFLFPLSADAHSCSEGFLIEINKTKSINQYCRKKTLGAEFGWNFNIKSRRLDIAFGARLDAETGWLAWGLNPLGRQMVGTRALIGIKQHSGSLEWHKYNVTELTKRGCQFLPSDDIGINVSDFSFVYLEKLEYYAILATIFLPFEYNFSRINVVWQIGDAAAGSEPLMHANSLRNFDTAETVDLVSEKIVSYSAHYQRHLRTMMALRLKPKFNDKYRAYWNMYHHFLGYALLALISVNMFEGIKILRPAHAWKWAYIGVLGVLGAVAMALEVFTWTKFLLYRNSIG
ncbi:hypothetical protein DH2020_033389 [Rehmannia glutinosa]|uniref:DOMON domain-containing protein n=1 Tax=Rehmannia glutinosa TaxID=99300 RepID=A0ABR0VE77_REHGL